MATKDVIRAQEQIEHVAKAQDTLSTKLSEEHHSVLFEKLRKHSHKWREIGLFLGFLARELSNIQGRPLLLNDAPNSWLSTMLEEWGSNGLQETREEAQSLLALKA